LQHSKKTFAPANHPMQLCKGWFAGANSFLHNSNELSATCRRVL